MSKKELAAMKQLAAMRIPEPTLERPNDRRYKSRFPIQREMRYKVLQDNQVVEIGTGRTVNVGSGGAAFRLDHELVPGCLIELSISWPVLLDNTCAVRLVTYGQLVRSRGGLCACTFEKYEFRTQARVQALPARTDTVFQRWADNVRKVNLRVSVAQASAS
jgi:PilZ domain